MAHHDSLVQESVRLSFLDAPKWAIILYIIFSRWSNTIQDIWAHPRRIWCPFACPGNAIRKIFLTRPTALLSPVSLRYLIINYEQSAQFSDHNAPTRAYIDEPRPRRRSSSLTGKIIHPSYRCLIFDCVLDRHRAELNSAEGQDVSIWSAPPSW